MKALAIVALLFLTGCRQQYFHFGDKVRITKGFYAGCIGYVTTERISFIIFHSYYITGVSCGSDTYVTVVGDVNSMDLEKL